VTPRPAAAEPTVVKGRAEVAERGAAPWAVPRRLVQLLDLQLGIASTAVTLRRPERLDLQGFTTRGRSTRHGLAQATARLLDVIVPLLVDEILKRVDLDAVARRLDLDALIADVDIDAAASKLDVAAVIDRVDLAALARGVIVQLDLPQIIRESTGSLTSDTVRGVRMQSISGDDALGRIIDRLARRRPRPRPVTPSLSSGPGIS
jgi:hypothetical protein